MCLVIQIETEALWPGASGLLGHLDRFPGVLSTPPIQNIAHPCVIVAWTTNGNPQHQPYHFPRPRDAKFPRRGDHGRPGHNKTPNLFDGLNKCDVLTSIQTLGEPASRSVGVPSAKEETSAHQSDESARRARQEMDDAPPEWYRAFKVGDAATTGC